MKLNKNNIVSIGAIKGNRIEICVGSHSEAYAKGVLRNVPVYIVE